MESSIIRSLLVDLLSAQSPELGARLKQRLSAKYLVSGLGIFDEKVWGWRKFGDFLENFSDIVTIQRLPGASDIQVSLKTPAVAPVAQQLDVGAPHPKIRSAVWQAFLNPDPRRTRYFNRVDREVIHFLEGQDAAMQARVDAAPAEFIKIDPIDAGLQLSWMETFLDSISLSPNERAAIEPLVKSTYTSQVNAAFTRALGDKAASWRAYRLHKIIDVVNSWVEKNSLKSSDIYYSSSISREAHPLASPNTVSSDSKRRVIDLLELVTEDDIQRLVLPILMAAIVVRAKP